jgi:hypothetical protein
MSYTGSSTYNNNDDNNDAMTMHSKGFIIILNFLNEELMQTERKNRE